MLCYVNGFSIGDLAKEPWVGKLRKDNVMNIEKGVRWLYVIRNQVCSGLHSCYPREASQTMGTCELKSYAWAIKWPQETPWTPISTNFKPWPPNGPRRSLKSPFQAFSSLGHQTVPGASRKPILSNFKPWPPNGPRKPPGVPFQTFSSLGHQTLQGGAQVSHFKNF